ncbi:exopolyphosphatase/guanosine-5'-triphosphate,3'-diphosphate pyrophosphatase [Anaerosolibacter carboniphilus]|uniref:Exopolyphosphatase/guanosine-5'-triphosphate, 3'-diphosphate pyrophosphatase n=1 Tax=Anaerosolibacter carboniphilus TaxID=1417629 RepID=A0A841KYT6_9FIRM|nr:HD domain-containing protein [Anaerosolibacter carboniphilus]MBB6218946.1 exopolyphosphatase/guanosine-5'-triphosphate,3'-diphosphate pyrophosphatase [Anaerosolibacter carboniphilus]
MKKNQIIAAIDVGSHALRMKIAQISNHGQMKALELLRYPISLGRDTYAMGRVSFKTVDETCEILKGFKKLMADYGVKMYRAIATSAVREAQNRDYIADQIRLKTGLNLEIISNAEERFLTYKAIRENLSDHEKVRQEGAMIVDIGSGSIEVSVYRGGHLAMSQNIKLGSLRLREVLSSIEGRTLNFPKILEEYISSSIDQIHVIKEEEKYGNFIALGGEIRIIKDICNKEKGKEQEKIIEREHFIQLYDTLMDKSTYSISEEYGVSPERADILLPSMMIFKKFLDKTQATGIHTPLVSLRDGIISDIVDKKLHTKREEEFTEDIIASARVQGKRYEYDEAHAREVEAKALLLFDELKKLHGLGKREKLLLQLAAILHDIGKYIDLNRHYVHSYHIIMALELMGISWEEKQIIANVARYHSRAVPNDYDENFKELNGKNKVIAAKLIAIIRLADSLDRSHKQKVKEMRIVLDDKKVLVKVNVADDFLLEEWTFETKAEFFEEVFGVTPVLKTKRMMKHG